MNNTLLNDQEVIEEIRRNKFLESSENGNTTYQKLWVIEKAILRRKFVLMSIYIKKSRHFWHCRLLTHVSRMLMSHFLNTSSLSLVIETGG